MTLLADPAERAGAPGPTAAAVDKAERARAVLRRAEERTGVRRHRPVVAPAAPEPVTAPAAPTVVPRTGTVPRAETAPRAGRAETAPRAGRAETAPRAGTALLAEVAPLADAAASPVVRPAPAPPDPPARARTRHVRTSGASRDAGTDERVWPVHDALAPLLPLGALQRGTVLAVRGSTSLLLALVARPSQAGAWTAAVGFPAVGLLAAADAGADLDRVVLVPRPGPDAALAISALVDGLDVVVVGPDAALTDPDRRRLAARARERGALLVAAGTWPGAHVALTVTGGGWSGADRGAGWLRRRTLVVERAGRGGAARPARLEVELPLGYEDWPAFLAEDARGPRPAAGTGAVAAGTAETAHETVVGPTRADDPDRPSRLRLVG
ncbi:hypothetical protein [Cellulosimicrobium cellulans]|uniref:hypothetical protein n=1 Tax=Cellulosimicrobium cellulans TaxID=1710 RepID=UPI001BAC158A|nr:hypothetical protein [Cellulosimicrobium cellulans]QUC00540.1 hypothetical protein J5A69_04665 [Cellulosimicrobium cellulans]